MDSIEKRREALLSKYRFVTSVSKKELAELQKKCNELDIPIGKVAPDMLEKMAIDDKSHFPHAVKTKKKITLNFKNGSSIEFKKDDKFKVPVNWKGVNSISIEQYLTKEEFKKLYPDMKIK